MVEARRRFGDRIRFLEGRAGSYAESFPYWPVRDLLRDWLGIGVRCAGGARAARAQGGARGTLARARSRPIRSWRALLGLPLEAEAEAALRELSREAVQQQTFAADERGRAAPRRGSGRSASSSTTCSGPTRSRSSSSRICSRLTDEVQLGIVLIYRAERDQPSWRLGEHARAVFPHRYHEIELRPLPAGASRELAEALAETRAARARSPTCWPSAPAATRSSSRRRSQDLIERGALRRRDGVWELADGQVAVPTLVQGALQARLDRLPPRTREVVSVASAIGRGFGLPLLERLLPHDQVVPALSDLMRLDLIVEVSRRPAPEYRFRHGLVQEVAYNSLLEPARRSLHRRIGEAIETLYGDAGDAVYGRSRGTSPRPTSPSARALLAARGRRGARRLRRPRGDRPLPARALVPAAG